MNIILVGFMASGKSTVGKILSKKHNLKFVDTDSLIERKFNKRIKDIFKENGENFFRCAEHNIISSDLKYCTDCIISTGGGMPCFYNNMDCLKNIGWVVYLKCDFETIKQRVKRGTRPLFENEGAAYNLFVQRLKCYEKSHFEIDASKDLSKVVLEIERIMKS